MNPTQSGRKTAKRRKRNTISWAAAFDKDERNMIKALKKATGGKLSASEIQRAAVRYAVPLMLRGEAPITERLTLTPQSTSASQAPGQ